MTFQEEEAPFQLVYDTRRLQEVQQLFVRARSLNQNEFQIRFFYFPSPPISPLFGRFPFFFDSSSSSLYFILLLFLFNFWRCLLRLCPFCDDSKRPVYSVNKRI